MPKRLKLIYNQRSQKVTDDLLLSIEKQTDTLIDQKDKTTRNFSIQNRSECTFLFNRPLKLEDKHILGVTGFEVFKAVLNRNEENNKVAIIPAGFY